ncbi:MAG: c-type cytochrome [Acidobacteriales bacterium]|nr:c-type cytochrome [Terriglobales bacterium]
MIVAIVFSGIAWGQQAKADGLTGSAGRGGQLYRRYCVYCHGPHGDGAGENAIYVDPRPRDCTKALFKCRSTASGMLPSDRDLYESITRGFYASGMPSWVALTKQQRIDLVAYVKTFSPRFKQESVAAPVTIPAEPASTPQSVQRGAELFAKVNCWSCHGKEGRGDGPSAATLTDSKGNPIRPYDLTGGTRFKCGSSDQELYRDLVNGLDGTPMPSFSDALKPDQIWDVVHYIHTLQHGGTAIVIADSDQDK